MAKSKNKNPHQSKQLTVPVFVYFVGFETIPSGILNAAGSTRTRKGSMVFRMPRPVRDSNQLRDLEGLIKSSLVGQGEGLDVIVTTMSALEHFTKTLTPQEEAVLTAQMEEVRKREVVVRQMHKGVEEVMQEATGPRDAD